MQRKIISIFLIISMVLTITPVKAYAVGGISQIQIGVYASLDATKDQNGSGWSWVAATKTFTLSGNMGDRIMFYGEDEINFVAGENVSSNYIHYGDGTLNIIRGNLTVNATNGDAIYANKLVVKDANITTKTSGELACGMKSKDDIAINNSIVTFEEISNKSSGMKSLNGNIVITGSAIKTASNVSFQGISASIGSVTISGNSEVKLKSSSNCSIYSDTLNITDSNVKAYGGDNSDAIYTRNGVNITGGTLTTGESSNNGKINGNLNVKGSDTNVTVNGNTKGNLTVENGKVNVTGTVSGIQTVTGGTVFVNGLSLFSNLISITKGTSDYEKAVQGMTVKITANDAATGYMFKEWEITPSVTFVDGTEKDDLTVKFTMPNEAVTIVAIYEDNSTAYKGDETEIDISKLNKNKISSSKWEYTGTVDTPNKLLTLKEGNITLTGTNNSLSVKGPDNGKIIFNNAHIISSGTKMFAFAGASVDAALFNGVNYNSEYDMELELIGDNSLKADYSLLSTKDLSLIGTGNLTITGGGKGIDIEGKNCTINGPSITASADSGKFPMGIYGGDGSKLDIQSGSLYLDNSTGNNYSAALTDNGDTLTVTVSTGAKFITKAGVNNEGDPSRDFWYEAGTQSNTTVTNNGGTIYIDGDVMGKAVNNSGTFEVTGSVAQQEGIITKPILNDVTVNINSIYDSSEYYDVSESEGKTILTAKKAANFTLTGKNPSAIWIDSNNLSTYTFNNMTISKYEISAYNVKILGTNNCGGTELAGNISGSHYTGNGILNVNSSYGNNTDSIGLLSDDGSLNIDGPTINIEGFSIAADKLVLKSGSFNSKGFVRGIEVQGGKAYIDDEYSDGYQSEWRVKYSGGLLRISTNGVLNKDADYTKPSTSIIFDEDGGTDVKDIYFWGDTTGESILEPNTPTKSEYNFGGWYSDAEFNNKATFPYTISGDKTYYAKWSKEEPTKKYKLTVVAGTGTGEYEEGAQVTIEANTAPEGKEFSKWNVEPEVSFIGGTNSVNPTAKFRMLKSVVTASAIYVNVSEPTQEYKITLNTNYGTMSSTSKFTENGGKLANLTALARKDYRFEGWFTKPSGSEKITAETVFKQDTIIYAHWTYVGDSGSKDDGGSSSVHTVPTAKTETTVTGNTAVITVATTVDDKGRATSKVIKEQINEAIKMSKEVSLKTEKSQIDIKISGDKGASVIETIIPEISIKDISSGNLDSLTISSGVGSITFDEASIGTVSDSAAGDVTITIAKADISKFSDEIREKIGKHALYDFSVKKGSKDVSKFGGNVTVSVPYTLKAGEDINAIIIYYINDKNELEIVTNGRYDDKTGNVVFTTNHFSTYAIGYNKIRFNDVAEEAWYQGAVTFIAARNLTSGTGNGNFSPDAPLTRGQFITLLLKTYEIKGYESFKNNFTDAGNTYYTDYLATAKKLGISEGIGNNFFAPEKEITREDMFAMLYNTLEVTAKLPKVVSEKGLSDFFDSGNVATYAQKAMNYLIEANIISGNNSNLLPREITTRAQMAQLLYNLMEK
ncbi:putative repeat protein (TIGR02543 family) [Sedimentibacter acidaminivorans]|uniref:Repeat protein (TIGR02543 family) n=1 Tax=Sedimentibacter acidaminivorans TaxID=913099 RepID=A0ABS4G9T3_9FIRM|nr:S-layer homology domain-containing protein [Sedimentibacter acidaminivorans]MBP1924438.1 putative repeat protein (TIGR02543 family) [Sedimentibacter acidaminivorans]